MTTQATGPEATERGMRADARRNRDRLITAARAVFALQGGSASMEAIAKEAGVGVGTLYRHFPRRIDVVEAVYRNDVDELMLAADKAMANLEPWPALVAYLEAFQVYAQAKRTFLYELHEAFEKHPELRLESRERIDASMDAVLRRAQAAGVARTDITGADLFQLLASVCTSATLAEGQAERLVGMIVDGLRQ